MNKKQTEFQEFEKNKDDVNNNNNNDINDDDDVNDRFFKDQNKLTIIIGGLGHNYNNTAKATKTSTGNGYIVLLVSYCCSCGGVTSVLIAQIVEILKFS